MTSRFARLSIAKQIVSVAILCLLPSVSFPATAQAHTEQNKQRQVFEINNVHKFLTAQLNPEPEDVVAPEPEPVPEVDPNIAILQTYLEKKGSPLAPYAEDILQHENWKLVLAISNGESTMCKHQIYNNCWGVGGAWNMRHYASFSEGFADVNRFLTEKYVAKGADTPAEIVNKYVGHPNANWVLAVNKILTEVNQLPLVN